MKILILGSEGFVGNNLVCRLEKSHEIFCADQLESSLHKNYSSFDITNFDSVQKIVKNVDVVIHLAAHSLISSIDGSITNGRVNIIGLLNLLEVCKKHNIGKVIFTSASSLIGEPKSYKVSEDHPAIPKTAYGITKLTSEHYLRLYNELYDINYVIFRFFNIYGPYQKNGLIPSLYGKLVKNEPLTVFGNGDQIRDYVFIKDVIPFFEKAASTTIANNSIFNMGTGKGTTIKQVIDILSKTMKVDAKIEQKSERPGEIGNYVANTDRLNSIFKHVPETSVEDGINQTVDWLKTNSI